MSYVFEKHYTVKYEVEKVKRNFVKFESFHNVRKDITGCELCDKKFREGHNTNLAFIKGKKNHLICDRCAEKAIEAGAESINWG
jgi:hypothetical protein